MPAIVTNDLTKVFKTYRKEPGLKGAVRGLFRRHYVETKAANRVTFSIEPGELVGFLGPNGAGKTTVLKMLSGLLFPTSGTAQVLGYVPWERANDYRRQFALLLGQKNQLWWDLPARESLELNREIYRIERADFDRIVDELTSLLEVKDKMDVQVRELSLGERMKMELVASLIHSPRVMFLDEPTLGLDVVSQKKVREFIREYQRRRQVTILLTSHYMADIEALCSRVIIIDKGSIFFDGPLTRIIDRFADYKLIRVHSRTPLENGMLVRFGEVLDNTHGVATLKVKRGEVMGACKAMVDNLAIVDLDIEEVPVEEVIREIFSSIPPKSEAK